MSNRSHIPVGSWSQRSGNRPVAGRELEQIWRLLHNIRSTRSDLLDIRYSPDGIWLDPQEQGGAVAGADETDAGTTTVPVRITGVQATQGVGNSSSSSSASSDLGPKTYVCDIYENGPEASATSTSVDVIQLNQRFDEEIPTGTWAMASQVNSVYYMQVPVWL